MNILESRKQENRQKCFIVCSNFNYDKIATKRIRSSGSDAVFRFPANEVYCGVRDRRMYRKDVPV